MQKRIGAQMSFFSRMFGRSTRRSFTMPKSASIYYSGHSILVATTYWDTTGWSGGGQPMALISTDSPARIIGEHVLRSIDASRDELSEQELKRVTADLFRLASAGGWEELERQWERIGASTESNDGGVKLLAMRRGENGGYVAFEGDPKYQVAANPEAIGQAVLNIVDDRPAPSARSVASGNRADTSVEHELLSRDKVPDTVPSFKVGERVVDAFGKEGKVVHIDPTAEHGLGTIRILYDDGRLHDYALIASGLERVK